MTAYIRPSQCEQCVPIETVAADSWMAWTTELAHEPTCPNNPTGAAK
ncbi:hypothetical protein [Arthrobacter sp. M4]|nr:hypothetical protein [Arthrobacter sp. M4]MCA4132946.1 hypothetical protein [Arthrobacter sp. M4]